MMISKHSPENCPAFNAKTKKSSVELGDKMEELHKKHDVKMIGSWVDMPQHTLYSVFECTFDDLQALAMEPEMMDMISWTTTEIKSVLTNEQVTAMLKMG